MNKNGFTLLEISMVLTLIALIIGGISIGSSLLRNAEVQNVYSESARYVSAIKNFQDKYQAMPGDIPTANSLFGTLASDGDGDGLIAGDLGNSSELAEQFQAWVHLALAGLVEGSFSGSAGSLGSSDRLPGVNIPASQLAGGGWGLLYATPTGADVPYVAGDVPPGHVLWLGGRSTTGTDNEQNPVLTAEEAEDIDRKMDDANPNTGRIIAQTNGTGSACYASDAYAVATAGQICSIVFKTGY